MQLPGVDLANPDLFLAGWPHEAFVLLRAKAPVYWHEEANGPGFWVVSKYHDVQAVPLADRHLIFKWSNDMIGFDDPEYGGASAEVGKIASMQMYMYANELAVERKKSPRDDLVSVLMAAEVDGEKLTEVEFDSFFLLLAVAGNETTRNLISGGMLALMQHPDERRRLLADPSLMPTAVEELLRRLPDIELAGPVERLRSNFINGIKRMPVRFTPERS